VYSRGSCTKEHVPTDTDTHTHTHTDPQGCHLSRPPTYFQSKVISALLGVDREEVVIIVCEIAQYASVCACMCECVCVCVCVCACIHCDLACFWCVMFVRVCVCMLCDSYVSPCRCV